MLLQNMGILRHDIWEFWPVILIAVGIARVLDARGTGAYIWAGILITAGAIFLSDNLGLLYFKIELLWPLLVIGFGVSMFARSMDRKRYLQGVSSSSSSVNQIAIFGGGKRRIDTLDFKGGDILAVFGGVEMDLSHSEIASGQATLDINAMFGGVELRVPETWTVDMRGTGIFGGYEDKTIPPRPGDGARIQTLVVTGYATFGGVSIKN